MMNNRDDASWPLSLYQSAAHRLWQYDSNRAAEWQVSSSVFIDKWQNEMPDWIALDELVEASHTLALLCPILLIGWFVAMETFNRCWPAFRALTPARQWYVVNNLSKALNLAIMCLSPSFITDVHDAYVLDDGFQALTREHAMWIKRVCALYVSSDIVSLFVVPKLPASTVQHHVVASLLTLCVFATRFADGNIAPMIALYGAWSSLAFPVNAFLALRCMYDERWWMAYLAGFSCMLYAICCAFNWSMHVVWFVAQVKTLGFVAMLTTLVGQMVLMYWSAVCVWARDDLILQSWLIARMQGKSSNK